jgi:DUF1009 family protein
MGRLAIIAGSGALPGLIAAQHPAVIVRLAGVPTDAQGSVVIDARLERLGQLFTDLRAAGVSDLCLAGAMRRASFDTTQLDDVTAGLLPRVMAAQARGDDALLRDIMAIFEEQGFCILGADRLRPDLVAPLGTLAGVAAPDGDAARARAVLAALGPLDVGQAAIAAKGQMLGIETLQGTDAMLRYVADTAPGSRGVLVKRAKPGQDLRVDMPAIGPDTIALAAAAGLSGIEVQAGHVLMLDAGAVVKAAQDHGLSLWAVP